MVLICYSRTSHCRCLQFVLVTLFEPARACYSQQLQLRCGTGHPARAPPAAKRFIVSLGILADRVETVGYGEEQPLDQEESEGAWARNRRDEFRVTTGRLAQQ